jgi:hypothetical protein
MDSVELLYIISQKINRFEFYYFTQDIISHIKQYDGLYQVFQLKVIAKMNIWLDRSEAIVAQRFDNKIVELYYIALSNYDNFFDYENTKSVYVYLYQSALHLLESETNKYALELIYNLLNGICKSLRYIDSYEGKEIWSAQETTASSLYAFEEIVSFFNKRQYNECLELISVYVYENGPVPYLSWLQNVIEFEDRKEYTSVDKIMHTIGDLFEITRMSENNTEMKLFYEIFVYSSRARIIQKVNIDPKSFKGFPQVLLLQDVPAHFPFQKCLQHLNVVQTTIKDRPVYKCYLDKLYRDKEFSFTKLFQDYVAINNNEKLYKENVYLYKEYKRFIHYYMRKQQNPIFRYNLFIAFQTSYFKTNQLYDNLQLQEFIDSFEISPEMRKKYGQQFELLQSKFRYVELLLEKKKFLICHENNLTEDICMICFDNVCGEHTATIQCKICRKELGHVNCLLEWLAVPDNKCPNCRSTFSK